MMLIENRDYLRIHQRSLLEKLKKFENKDYSANIIVEPSRKGSMTLKMLIDGKMQYLHSKYDPESEAERLISQIKNINQYDHVIFIGTGLGYHINEFITKRPNISFSIYEPNLTMLYQFLSYFDLSKYPKAKLEKIITTENEDEIKEEIHSLYKETGTNIFVYTIPSFTKIYNAQEILIMQFLKELMKEKRANLATDYSFQKRWTINAIKNFPKVIRTPNILHDINKDSFKDKPAIIVAAGPSLNEELDNLKYIKEKGLAYIFSVGSAINSLIEHDIYPHAACTYDPGEHNQKVFEKLKEKNIKDIPLIFGSSVGFETLENYPGKMLHMIISQDTVAPYLLSNSEELEVINDAPSIAVVTLQLLKKLGCNPIILVGQNLAFQNNKRYAEGINYESINSDLTEEEKESLILVKDVYGNDIPTNEGYNQMREQLELYINQFSDVEVINTTKGGANISGTVFKPLSDLISEKLIQTNNVKLDWYFAESRYNHSYLINQLEKINNDKRSLQKLVEGIIKVLREINLAVKMNSTKELEKKFIRLDKEFIKLRNNSIFKVFIEPMLRIHVQQLSEKSRAIRFETDLRKKGCEIAGLFGSFIIDCMKHFHFITPLIEELEDRIR